MYTLSIIGFHITGLILHQKNKQKKRSKKIHT